MITPAEFICELNEKLAELEEKLKIGPLKPSEDMLFKNSVDDMLSKYEDCIFSIKQLSASDANALMDILSQLSVVAVKNNVLAKRLLVRHLLVCVFRSPNPPQQTTVDCLLEIVGSGHFSPEMTMQVLGLLGKLEQSPAQP